MNKTWKNRVVEQKTMPIDQLQPNPGNWRIHPEVQQKALHGAIAEIGYIAPVIWNKRTGRLIDGHLRLSLAQKNGQDNIPVTVVDLSEEEENIALATIDPLSALAEADADLLKSLMDEVNVEDPALKDMLDDLVTDAGINDGENNGHSGGLTAEDSVPDVEKQIVSRSGDIWVLGKHRLMCGDATRPDMVNQLMAGEVADLCFTSPPYAQQREYTKQINDWDGLIQGVFSAIQTKDDVQILVNLGLVHNKGEWQPYWENWVEWMRQQGWRRFGWYVWDQGNGLPGDWGGRLAPSHEFIFHFNRIGVKPRKTKDKKPESIERGKNQKSALRDKDGVVCSVNSPEAYLQPTKIPDSVIRVNRHCARGIECEHPAVFSVALATEIQTAFSDEGDIIYEPFCGSGTQLIAGEQTQRRVFAMDVAPIYVDLAVRRWQEFTGRLAVLERTEQVFDIIAEERVDG